MKAAHHPALGFSVINLVSLKGFRVLASVNARSWIRWLLFIVMDFMFQSHKVAQGLSAGLFFFHKIKENEMCWSISASPAGFSSPALGMEQTLLQKMEFLEPVLSKSSSEGAKWGLITA